MSDTTNQSTATAQISTPPCPACGKPLTAAYDDGAPFWECDGCGRDFAPFEATSSAEPAFSCRHCDYTSDEYGDTHTHANLRTPPGQTTD